MKQAELNNELLDLTEFLLAGDVCVSFRMKGYSMYPLLRPGDVGIVQKCDPMDLKAGDIIAFKNGNGLVAHRFLKTASEGGNRFFIAKGDKNYHTDAPFTGDAIIGRITQFSRAEKPINVQKGWMKYAGIVSLHYPRILAPLYNLLATGAMNYGNITEKLRSLRKNISIISEGSGRLFLLNAAISALQGIIPLAIIVCIKYLVDLLSQPGAGGADTYFFVLLGALAALFLANGLLGEVGGYLSEKLSQSVNRHIYGQLHAKHVTLELSEYEHPGRQDKMHRAVQEASFRPVKMLNELLTGIKSATAAVVLAGLFFTISWHLPVILLVAILPGVLVRLRFARRLHQLKQAQATTEREMYYFNRILTGFPFAKELKLFGFSWFFRKRFEGAQENLFSCKNSLRQSELKWNAAAHLFSVALIFMSLGLVALLSLKGAISIGTVVLFFFAFQRGYSVMNELFRFITRIIEDNVFLNDFIGFMDLPVGNKDALAGSIDFKLNNEIRLENVSFSYETSKRHALKSVNIRIPAGKTVAFVGENGSGKTTLVKLLCGFYAPDHGRITFDGKDAALIGRKNIFENITAVFQDFALYNIPAYENIALGNPLLRADREKVYDAARAAGIHDVLMNLPEGYDTMLGTLFQRGEELSIGQWQKMAIARAFYRDSPLIIMDEPSSALDAKSEEQVLYSLKQLAKNKTAIIISHRLASVQWADLIYFFHEGEVVEWGTHEELMALRGHYFSLYKASGKQFAFA